MQETGDQDVSLNTSPESMTMPTPSAVAYRMRCPNCQKLYSVEPHLIIGIAQPKFQCVTCESQFSAQEPATGDMLLTEVIAPSPVVEKPVQPARRAFELAPTVASRPCPKCGTRIAIAATECVSCGVVVARFRQGEEQRMIDDLEVAGRLELVTLWDDLATDYRNLAKHDAFVKACYADDALAFATQKYGRVLAGAPDEEIARTMRKRIMGLARAKFEVGATIPEPTRWNIPLPSFNSFIVMLGSILLFIGIGLPNSRDIAGLGFAMLALAAGLRIYTRRPA